MIVCHITEGSYAGAVSWLCNPDAEASAHFVVAKDGRVTQLVELTDSAWCNGTSIDPTDKKYYGHSTLAAVRQRATNANYYTISIEHEGIFKQTKGRLTDAQLKATIELIAWIRSEVKRLYGVNIPLDREHIVGHYQINPITKPNCPGYLFPFNEIIKQKEAKPKVENLVVYGKKEDKAAAEMLAYRLMCPVMDADIPFDYSTVKNVYCVGAPGQLPFTSYAKAVIAGLDRIGTMQKVLEFKAS